MNARDFYNKRKEEDNALTSVQLMEEYAKHVIEINLCTGSYFEFHKNKLIMDLEKIIKQERDIIKTIQSYTPYSLTDCTKWYLKLKSYDALIKAINHAQSTGEDLDYHIETILTKRNFKNDLNVGGEMEPTMKFRWLETNKYIPTLDTFEKVLQQCHLVDQSTEIWVDVPSF